MYIYIYIEHPHLSIKECASKVRLNININITIILICQDLSTLYVSWAHILLPYKCLMLSNVRLRPLSPVFHKSFEIREQCSCTLNFSSYLKKLSII